MKVCGGGVMSMMVFWLAYKMGGHEVTLRDARHVDKARVCNENI